MSTIPKNFQTKPRDSWKTHIHKSAGGVSKSSDAKSLRCGYACERLNAKESDVTSKKARSQLSSATCKTACEECTLCYGIVHYVYEYRKIKQYRTRGGRKVDKNDDSQCAAAHADIQKNAAPATMLDRLNGLEGRLHIQSLQGDEYCM
eukprot:4453948-Pleurochrysis_carterae.AAC.2